MAISLLRVNRFYLTFMVIIVPFFFVNSALTLSFIRAGVVGYNNSESPGIRILLIPMRMSVIYFV